MDLLIAKGSMKSTYPTLTLEFERDIVLYCLKNYFIIILTATVAILLFIHFLYFKKEDYLAVGLYVISISL